MARKEVTHFTNTERSKIYHAKKIRSEASLYTVPKGKTKIKEREKIVKAYIRKIKGTLYCTALDSEVAVTRLGIIETTYRASGKYKSALAALNLEDALLNASWIKTLPIKRNVKAQKIFKRLHLLAVIIKEVGIAKIIIGEVDTEKYHSEDADFMHYCITQVSVKDIK